MRVLTVFFSALTICGFAQADTQVRASSFEYTVQGLLSKETVEPGKADHCLQTTYQYDAYGNRTAASSSACVGANATVLSSAATARSSSTAYTADGRFPVSSANVLGQSETKTYDARFGAIASLTGPNGLTTRWVYDNFGRKIQEIRADGTSTSWTYKLCTDAGANCPGPIAGATATWVLIEQSYAAANTSSGPATTSTIASAPEKRQYYDTLNRAIRVQTQGFDGGANGQSPTLVQDTQYNALGQVAAQSDLYDAASNPVWTTYTYDRIGRVLTQSHPDPAASGGLATVSYNYNGLSVTVTNPQGQTKTTTKNAQGQIASVTDALGSTITYTYDALGNLLATNAAGSVTAMQYDQRGRKTAMQDPAMGNWTYRYNAFGELVSQTDSVGQTVTMAYDNLGRLIQKNEPDLTSQWSYDKNFDGTACGKGLGKLCQAKASNGYDRKHSYDSLGRVTRTSTILDNAASPATVSVAYETTTGRVISKTWPTGYQASYNYSKLGYIQGVTGGGTNGFSQTTNYQVLAMDAAGHITQYKLGNKVTTVKTFDPQTQRLKALMATTDGQANGNVLNQNYNYDALGNLLSRNDNSPGVGTQESFSYDSLSRLTMATILGGAVSPPTSTQVMYDPRGNIAYKSDVGRYWYDPDRPNRMTNVTLETAPSATIPLSGTRALSYTFDDYNTGAMAVSGSTTGLKVGNGNLTYTVSRDTTNNLHTTRFESYTSFNMPLSMTYSNFRADTSTCPQGYKLSAGKCTITSIGVFGAAKPIYECLAGQTLQGDKCSTTTTAAATPNYTCPVGQTLSGTICVVITTSLATVTTNACPKTDGVTWWQAINKNGVTLCLATPRTAKSPSADQLMAQYGMTFEASIAGG